MFWSKCSQSMGTTFSFDFLLSHKCEVKTENWSKNNKAYRCEQLDQCTSWLS